MRFTRTMWRVAVLTVVALATAGVASAQESVLDQVPRDAVAFVVFQDPAELDGKLSDLMVELNPPPPDVQREKPSILPGLMSEMLGGPELLKPGTPLVLVMAMDREVDDDPLVAVMLEVTDLKAVVGEEAKPGENGVYELSRRSYCLPTKGGRVLIGDNEDALLSISKLATGVKLTDAQKRLWDGRDVYAQVNLAQIVKTFTPDYDKLHKYLTGDIAETEAKLKKLQAAGTDESATGAAGTDEDADDDEEEEEPEDAATLTKRIEEKRLGLALLDRLWVLANETESLTLAGTLSKEGVDVLSSLALKTDGTIAGYLDGHPPIGATLVPALPAADNVWVAMWYSVNVEKIQKAASEVMGGIVGLVATQVAVEDDEDAAKIMDLLRKYERMVTDQLSMLGGRGSMLAYLGEGGSLMNSLAVTKVTDAATYRKAMQDYVKSTEDVFGGFMKLAENEGEPKPEFKIDYQTDVKVVDGISLDRMEMTIKMKDADPEAAEAMKLMMKQLLGGETVTSWIGFRDGYALTQMGAEPTMIAEAAKLAGGQGGLAEDPAIAALRKHTLPEANIVTFVSATTYVQTVMSMVEGAMGGAAAAVDPNAAKVKSAASMAMAKGRVDGQLFVPTQEMKQVFMAYMAMQQREQMRRRQMMEDMMRRQEELRRQQETPAM